MAKKLSCWVGRHVWTTRVEQGEKYRVCSECGGTPRQGKNVVGRAHDHHAAMYDGK